MVSQSIIQQLSALVPGLLAAIRVSVAGTPSSFAGLTWFAGHTFDSVTVHLAPLLV